MNIEFFGHSCFRFESNGSSVIIDPWFGSKELPAMDIDDVKVDSIILTHGH